MEDRIKNIESNITVLFSALDKFIHGKNLDKSIAEQVQVLQEKLKQAEEELEKRRNVLQQSEDRVEELHIELEALDNGLKESTLSHSIEELVIEKKNNILDLIEKEDVEGKKRNVEDMEKRISIIEKRLEFLDNFSVDI